MRDIEYVAYEGEEYIIEWYYTGKGKSPALEYYKRLKKEHRLKLLYLLKRLGDTGKIIDTTKFNSEGDQIFAFKPQPERFLCFFVKQSKIIITNGFCKKQKKLPKNEKQKALDYKKDYERRFKDGEYYD